MKTKNKSHPIRPCLILVEYFHWHLSRLHFLNLETNLKILNLKYVPRPGINLKISGNI